MKNKLKLLIKNSIGGGLTRTIIISLFATLACVGIIKAATTVGNNITTGGTITGSGANTLYGATSIGGALTATSTLTVSGLTTLGNASTTVLSVSGNSYITGVLSVTGNSIFSTASSTGIVKFPEINSDTGAISFGDENLSTTGSITSGSVSDSLIIGTEGYIDFKEGGSGIVKIGGTGNTNNESLKYDFESETNKIKVSSGSGATEISYVGMTVVPGYTKMLREIDALLPLKLAIGFTTPSNNELDSISQSNLTYKNVAYSEIQTLGGVNQLVTTGNNEYICTGTNSVCANDANYSFPDTGLGSGFIMGGYFNFTDVATSQVLFSKLGTTATTKEYRLIYNGASDKYVAFQLYDSTTEVGCVRTSSVAVSVTGWKSIFVAYDGFGTTAAGNHMRMWINGVPSTLTGITCFDYSAMINVNTIPFILGTQVNLATPWLGNIAPFIIADQPDSTNLSSSPTSYDDEILNIHNIMTSHLGL